MLVIRFIHREHRKDRQHADDATIQAAADLYHITIYITKYENQSHQIQQKLVFIPEGQKFDENNAWLHLGLRLFHLTFEKGKSYFFSCVKLINFYGYWEKLSSSESLGGLVGQQRSI